MLAPGSGAQRNNLDEAPLNDGNGWRVGDAHERMRRRLARGGTGGHQRPWPRKQRGLKVPRTPRRATMPLRDSGEQTMTTRLSLRLGARWLAASVPVVLPGVAVAAPGYEIWVRSDPELVGCPNAAELEGRVNERLGRDASIHDEDGSPPLTVRVRFAVQERTTRAHIRGSLDSDTVGERVLEAPARSCSELVEATVLAITLLVEEATVQAENGPREPAIGASPQPVGEPSLTTSAECAACTAWMQQRAKKTSPHTPPQPPSCPTVAPRVAAGLDVVGVVGQNVGPETAWGVGVRGTVGLGKTWGLTWGSEYLSGGSVTRNGYELGFGQATFWVGPVLVLAVAQTLTIEPELALLGGVSVVATNPVDPGEYPLFGERVGMVIGLTPWRLPIRATVGAHARVLSFRDVYETEGTEGPQWRQPRVGFTAELGLGLREW